ncbi:MAG: hypothetical protein QXL54_04585 [Candidatus Bathyarchaeia archaeon]
MEMGYEEKLAKYEAEKAQKAKLFNPKELVEKSRKIKSVYVEELGEVRYGVLTLADMFEVAKAQSNEERGAIILWLMLSKADSSLTLDDVKALPMDVAAKLLTVLTKDMAFLTPTK